MSGHCCWKAEPAALLRLCRLQAGPEASRQKWGTNPGAHDERFSPRVNTCTSHLVPFPIHIWEDSQQQQGLMSALQGFFSSPISFESVGYSAKVRAR